MSGQVPPEMANFNPYSRPNNLKAIQTHNVSSSRAFKPQHLPQREHAQTAESTQGTQRFQTGQPSQEVIENTPPATTPPRQAPASPLAAPTSAQVMRPSPLTQSFVPETQHSPSQPDQTSAVPDAAIDESPHISQHERTDRDAHNVALGLAPEVLSRSPTQATPLAEPNYLIHSQMIEEDQRAADDWIEGSQVSHISETQRKTQTGGEHGLVESRSPSPTAEASEMNLRKRQETNEQQAEVRNEVQKEGAGENTGPAQEDSRAADRLSDVEDNRNMAHE